MIFFKIGNDPLLLSDFQKFWNEGLFGLFPRNSSILVIVSVPKANCIWFSFLLWDVESGKMWALCGRLQFVDASLPQPLFYNFGWQLKTSASCIHADGGKIYLVRRNKLASSIDAIAVSEIWNYEWVNDPLTAPKIFDKKNQQLI